MIAVFGYFILLCVLPHLSTQRPAKDLLMKNETSLSIVDAIPAPPDLFHRRTPVRLKDNLLKSNIYTEREGIAILDDLDACSTVILDFKQWTNGAVVSSVLERIKDKMNVTIDDADLMDSVKINFKHLSITSFEDSTKGLYDVNSGDRLEFVSALIFGLGIFSGLVFGKVEALVENFLSQNTQDADLHAMQKFLNATVVQQKRNRLESAYSLASYALQQEFEDMLTSILQFNAPTTLLLRDKKFVNGLEDLMGSDFNSSVLKNNLLSYGHAVTMVPVAVDVRRSALITEICYPRASQTYQVYKAYSLGGFEGDTFVYKDIPSHVIAVDNTFYPLTKSDCTKSIYGLFVCSTSVSRRKVRNPEDIEVKVTGDDFLFVRTTRSGYLIATKLADGILIDAAKDKETKLFFNKSVSHVVVPTGMRLYIGNETFQCRQSKVELTFSREDFHYTPQPKENLPSFIETRGPHLSSGISILISIVLLLAAVVLIKKVWTWKKTNDDRIHALEVLVRSQRPTGTFSDTDF